MRRTHSFSDMRLCAKPSFRSRWLASDGCSISASPVPLSSPTSRPSITPRLHTTTNKQVTVNAHFVQARALAPDDDRTLADLSMLIARSAGGLGRRAQVYAAICDAVDRYERLGDVRALAGALLHLGNTRRRPLLLPLSLNEESNRRVSSLLEPLGDSPSL